MKSLYNFLLVMVVGVAVSSCDKVELPDYSGMDAIFFDQQFFGENNEGWIDTTRLVHKLYTPVSFASTNRKDTVLAIKVETAGYVRDYPRPFGVHIVSDSTTAIEGVEFELLDDTYAILPGNNSTCVHVKCNFTDRMYKDRLQIQLALDAGEHFVLPFSKYAFGDMPLRNSDPLTDPVPESRNYDSSIHNIFLDCILTEPEAWPKPATIHYLGEWSEEKFSLILQLVEYRGWTAVTFSSYDTMPTGRAQIVNNIVAKYLRDQYDKGEYVLEADGRLMWVRNSLVTWSEETTPADIVK